jgi:acyl-CoA thioester hydrolase
MPSQSLVSSSTVRVRYSETDQMGFVYHPHYLVWCEIARTDFIRAVGVTYAQLERDGLLLAVISAELRYVASGRYDDVVQIDCKLEKVQSRSLTFAYDITRREPEPPQRLASAVTKLVSLDRNGTPRTLPAELLQRFKNLVAIHDE